MHIRTGDSTAIVWKDKRISYSELLARAADYASLYAADKAEKVAIFAENRPEWAFAFVSAWINEAIAVPIDYMSPADDVAYILKDCAPEVVFYTRETEKVIHQAAQDAAVTPHLFLLDDLADAEIKASAADLTVDDWEQTAAIIYTSGTTGSPKGVMLSFDNLMANIEAVCDDIPIFNPERSVLALLPMHHIFPLMGTLIAPLYAGGIIAFSPTMASEDILNTLQANRVAIIIGVPRLYAAIRKGIMDKINAHFITRALFGLARRINSQSFSRKLFKKVHQRFGGHVEFMVSGGAKLPDDVARDYKTLGFEMLEGFGMTEAAPMITFTRPGDWLIGSAGKAMPCLEVTTMDGEIVARGRNIMQGYYNRPEETADVLKDGWLHTGDLGHIDAQGFLHVTGRSKEIIVLSSGKNINPEEIEHKLLNTSDLIAEVGVFLADDQLNAAILPDFKQMRERGIVNMETHFRWEIINQYNGKVAPYKKISRFQLLKTELPRTRLGKLQRFRLLEMIQPAAEHSRETTPEPEMEEYAVIRDYLVEQTNNPVHPDDHIELDLGLDSLDKVGFMSFLDATFGVNIREDILLHYPTIEKLAGYVRDKKKRVTIEAVKWAEIFREKVELKLPRHGFMQNVIKYIARFFFAIWLRVRGEGAENIPQGPCILAPNHQSYIDGLFVSVFLKNRIMNNTYFYAKEKHVRKSFMNVLARWNNVIVMDVNQDLKRSLQKLAEVLKQGKNIIIFPEGTRTHTGQLGKFKKAAAILACEMNVPIVPVSIKGAFEAMPRGSRFPKLKKSIQVKFLQPSLPSGHTYESLLEDVRQKLAGELA